MKQNNIYNKIIWLALIALVMVFTISCENNRLQQDIEGDRVTITLLVGTDNTTAAHVPKIMTGEETDHSSELVNSIGKGRYINKLVCAVYDVNGNLLTEVGETADGQIVRENIEQFPVEIEIGLVRGQVYQIVLWAQSSECSSYNTADLQHVEISYSNALNNDETRDAFCAVEKFTVVQNGARRIVLNRPFAQINLGMTVEDFSTTLYNGINLTKSAFSISGLATEYNVLTGIASTQHLTENTVFAANEMLSDYLYLGNDTQRKAYKYLSMCYVLVPDPIRQTDVTGMFEDLNFELIDIEHEQRYLVIPDKEVPIRKNWVTNIIAGIDALYPAENEIAVKIVKYDIQTK